MAARITSKENAEIKRLVKNANAKRNRLLRKGIPADRIPYRFSGDTIDGASRQQVNEFKQTLKSFTNRNNTKARYNINEKGYVYTDAQRIEFERVQRQANRRAKTIQARYKNEPYRIIAEEIQGIKPSTKRTVGRDRFYGRAGNVLYTRTIDDIASEKQFKEYINRMLQYGTSEYNLQQDTIYKQNYITALQKTFGSESNELIAAIWDMPLSDFIYTYYTTDADITFVYSRAEYYQKLNVLYAAYGIDKVFNVGYLE